MLHIHIAFETNRKCLRVNFSSHACWKSYRQFFKVLSRVGISTSTRTSFISIIRYQRIGKIRPLQNPKTSCIRFFYLKRQIGLFLPYIGVELRTIPRQDARINRKRPINASTRNESGCTQSKGSTQVYGSPAARKKPLPINLRGRDCL